MRRDEIKRYFTQKNYYSLNEGKMGRLSTQKSEFQGCDLSGFDPEFLDFLSFFERENVNKRNLAKDKIQFDKAKRVDERTILVKIADFFSTRPNFVNSVFIDEMNKGVPLIGLILGEPTGMGVICKEITRLSQVFSAAKRKATGEMTMDPKYAANAARDTRRQYSIDGDAIKDAANTLETILQDPTINGSRHRYTDATNTSLPTQIEPLFRYTSQANLTKLNQSINGTAKNFDLVLMNALTPNNFFNRMLGSNANYEIEFGAISELKNKIDDIETEEFRQLFSELLNLKSIVASPGSSGGNPDMTVQVPRSTGNPIQLSDANVKVIRYTKVIEWMERNSFPIADKFKTTNNFIVYFSQVLDKIKSMKS